MRPGSSGKASLSHFCSASERLENGFPSGSCPSRTQRYSDLPASLFRNKDQRMYRSDLRRATIRPLPSANRGETPERTGFHITARRTRLVGAPARNAVRRAKKQRCYENRSIAEITYSVRRGPRRSLDPQVASRRFCPAEPIWPERPDRTDLSSPCSCRPG